MVRVPLPFRGVAVLLLAATTVVGQTPEPPAELLSLDPLGPSTPDFLRQFSADSRHPLLTLMVDGELTSLEASAPQESSKLKPTPQASSAASKKAADDDCVVEDGLLDGCQLGTACPSVPNYLPFACSPPPCNCRKCQRERKHAHAHGGNYGCGAGYGYGCGQGYGYGQGYGNSYLNGPTCPAWCFYGAPLEPANRGCCGRHCGRQHGRGCPDYGFPYGGGYGGGWNMTCGDGFMEGGCGFGGYMPPPQQGCGCRRCQRHHQQQGCGNQGYGYPYGGGYGGGWGMGYGGYTGGGFCGGCMPYMPPPQQGCGCRKCQRHHQQQGYSYGYGCPGWSVNEGTGCGRHSRFHRHRGCSQPSYPNYPYPMMMPCMGGESFGSEFSFGGGELCLDSILGDTSN